MYTRCPRCSTVFVVQRAQLDAREGWVRCGQCENVFCAKDQVFDTLPHGAKIAALDPGEAAHTLDAAEPPTESERSRASARRSTHPVLWALLSLPLLAVLLAQLVFFYRGTLALDARAKPWVEEFCRVLACDIPRVYDVDKLELLDANVEAHPDYANVLRIQAEFVNRAGFPQPLPLLELTLVDRNGVTTGRRVFKPAQYVSDRARLERGMAPNVKVNAEFDVAVDGDSASGFEVQLFAP